ncbi:MAG TPA: AMP-binding protein [Chthonomonadales bacterium]|nr:AMP-binding protein [Chthonomonadales bacterium]
MSHANFPDRKAIESRQLTALCSMIATFMPSNRFYAQKLIESGLSGGPPNLGEFFARMPFTTKQELVEDQQVHPPYGTNLTFPIERYTRFSQTSGTTGTPLRWLDTTESWNWMVDNWVHVLRASGVTAKDRVFFAFSFGPFLGFWTAFEAGVRLGCMCLPGGGMSSLARLRTMLDNQTTVLCCTPTYAIRLAEVAAGEKIDLSAGKIKRIIVAGEPGGSIPTTRARIEAMWPGAQVRDHHGMTEVGPVSFECPTKQGVLHVMEHGFIPEVIDPHTGRHVGPGEKGELVLTNLGRVGSPLIRYRTGDLVQRASTEPCVCGRYDLALEGGILGRTDDMVVVRGVNIHPSAVEEVVRGFAQIAEYRVELRTERAMPEMTLWIEPTPECAEPDALRQAVEMALRAVFNLRIPVSVVTPGTLPRFELKARRWVRVDPAGVGEKRA